MVKRYDIEMRYPDAFLPKRLTQIERVGGPYVLYEDYKKLQVFLGELRPVLYEAAANRGTVTIDWYVRAGELLK